MRTTGGTFVVFCTNGDMLKALQTPLPKFRGVHEIRVRHMDCEPATVLWDGFGVTHAERLVQIVKGIFGLIMLMIAWAVLFWGPYTYYVLSWTKVGGSTQYMEGIGGFAQSTILGLLITVGNQAVYAACGYIAQSCRFKTTDSRDKLSVVLYTFAVSINTVLDLGLLTYMAHGFQQDSGMNESAFVRNPSMQHALFVQLVGYIYPGTILLPFLLEPIAMCLAPYYLFSWLIRSRPDVTFSRAEKCLECPNFDLNRYGDIIINAVLCSLIFFLTSVNIWWMFAQLVTSSVVIYVWDHCRFLRESQRTEFATNSMDVCAQYLTVFPCAVLAGALAFKYQGGQAMVRGWDRETFLNVRMEWIYVVISMLAHAVAHILLIYFVVPLFVREVEPEPCTYVDVAKESSCNWFNANPVHCIRSLHHYGHDPPHIYDYPGKSHLHKINPDIHAYYEAEAFEQEQWIFSDVMHEVKSARDDVSRRLILWRSDVTHEVASARDAVSRRFNDWTSRVSSPRAEPESPKSV